MKSYMLLLTVTLVSADVYLHVPRGSNNRLNEKSAERKNANRLFDSQNNNRGGYNHGDTTNAASGNDEGKQYRMKYFQSGKNHHALPDGLGGSTLTVEWTNQHGCGGNEDTDPHKQNCNLVLQYMCQDDVASPTGNVGDGTFRNGVQTNTQDYNAPNNVNENEQQATNRRNNVLKTNRGLQEPWENYDSCLVRERNKGLFTADQILQSDNGLGYSSAIYTRQNPNGNRRGYECPEERDYYPYWHPSPWKDAAVLAENQTMCKYYEENSHNVRPYHMCLEYWDGAKSKRKHYSRWNNDEDCQNNGGEWTLLYNYLEKAKAFTNKNNCESQTSGGLIFYWAIPHDTTNGNEECLVMLSKPDCLEAPWSRSNQLGNGHAGKANTYDWTLPYFPSQTVQRCVFRLRYNISTDDYDPYNTDYRHNKDKATMQSSPVEQNPYVDVGAGASPLRLAINTAQFGRTFQDRSHVFKLVPRPAGTDDKRIFNLNVRGKRGNIVQTFPAVEYDFAPNTLEMTQDDLVHIQWTGSNTHNNGNPAGDGQAGDAGEGTGGTDRSNFVQIPDRNDNYPLPYESSTIWSGAEVVWHSHGKTNLLKKDLALGFASAGYFACNKKTDCPEADLKDHLVETKPAMQNQLNNSPASYEGALLKLKAGRYHYMCSRNNNFTNRSQKGSIVVK